MTTAIGAVLAGGASRRFGSDKALADVEGRPLIEHALAALRTITTDVVVCGREWPAVSWLPDRPRAGMGPLSGLNAALHYARDNGADWVLTIACDTPFLPREVLAALIERQTPAYLSAHPVIGLWSATACDRLDEWLAGDHRHAMRAFAQTVGAQPWDAGVEIENFNYASDLMAWIARRGEESR